MSKIEGGVLKRLQGIDIDPLAVGISQLNISLKCCKPYEKLPMLAENILEGDSLFSNYGKKVDVIVGNPAYMQWRYIPKTYRQRLLEENDFEYLAKGSMDYSTFFFKSAHRRLKKNGILAFIATNKLLASAQTKDFRIWLSNSFDILKILDFRKKVFQGTDVETAIYILRKKSDGASHSKSYIDVAEFVRSEGHLEERLITKVPINLIENTPYRVIPTKVTDKILNVYSWFEKNKNRFSSLDDQCNLKAGLRITDIDADDVLKKRPPKSVISEYLPLLDGTCLEAGNSKIKQVTRWVSKDSRKLITWWKDIPAYSGYVILKELSSRPAFVLSKKVPAILNSLGIIFPKENSNIDIKDVNTWFDHPFTEAMMEFWFGPNRHHATQRWKNVYSGKLPIPKNGRIKGTFPSWVIKASLEFLEKEVSRSDLETKDSKLKKSS